MGTDCHESMGSWAPTVWVPSKRKINQTPGRAFRSCPTFSRETWRAEVDGRVGSRKGVKVLRGPIRRGLPKKPFTPLFPSSTSCDNCPLAHLPPHPTLPLEAAHSLLSWPIPPTPNRHRIFFWGATWPNLSSIVHLSDLTTGNRPRKHRTDPPKMVRKGEDCQYLWFLLFFPFIHGTVYINENRAGGLLLWNTLSHQTCSDEALCATKCTLNYISPFPRNYKI